MVIDLAHRPIRWTPQVLIEGQRYTVRVAVNDGSLFADTFRMDLAPQNPSMWKLMGMFCEWWMNRRPAMDDHHPTGGSDARRLAWANSTRQPHLPHRNGFPCFLIYGSAWAVMEHNV